MTIHPIDIILAKRDGRTLSPAEIEAFIQALVRKEVSDAQASAFLMAVFLRGLSAEELAALTKAMRFSGETFPVPRPGPLRAPFRIDKHSTGGVGDKTSLLIAPILAAAGLAGAAADGTSSITVPMISGRSLGHTGGTLDKLETIPGFNTQLSLPRAAEILARHAAVLMGQTPDLVPADRILYALRDHTGTVESPDLITASIMSKKLAENLDALVLDVKVGSGAFMPTYEASRHLAELMVETGEREGTTTVALLTSMDEPLGRFSGNWLEVRECLDILKQKRHPMSHDLVSLSNILAGWMLHLAGRAASPEAGALLADDMLTSGAAFDAFLEIVAAQGGDLSVMAGDTEPADLHQAGATTELLAGSSGFLSAIDCKQTGWAVQRLGAGRLHPGDAVSAAAGLEVHAKLGDPITAGQPLVTLYADTEAQLAEPLAMLRDAYRIADAPPKLPPQIREVNAR